MTETPQIDLGAETSLAAYEIGLIALALAVALAFLFRGVLRRRRGGAPACSSCGGCGSGDACKVVDYDFGIDPGKRADAVQGGSGSPSGS